MQLENFCHRRLPSKFFPRPSLHRMEEAHRLKRVIRNVILDWCGTLVDDLEAVWKATNKTFKKAGIHPLSLETFRREFALPFRPFYERYIPHVSEAQLETWFLEAFHQEMDSVKPFSHSLKFLEFCRQRGILMFVLSSIHKDHFVQHLKITRFGDYFQEAYVGVRDKRNKLEEVLETHGLNPSETLFIGDMQHDVEAAKRNAVRSCGVLTGFNTFGQLQEQEPDLIVEHLGELQRLLQNHDGSLSANKKPSDPGRRPPFTKTEFPIPTVGALIFNSSNQVFMLQTHKWSNKWGIPGGKIRWGETAEEALRREVLEETNLSVEDIRLALIQDAVRPPEFYQPAHFLLLNYTCRALPPLNPRLNHESQAFQWVPPQEALEMNLNHPTRKLIHAVNHRADKPATTTLPNPPSHKTDKIIIEEIEIPFRIGVPEEERAKPQLLRLSIFIEHSLQTAALSDDLSQTIDYATLADELASFGEGKEWKLLERLAHDLALWILQRFGTERVTVEAKKFILPNARHVSVRLTRSKDALKNAEK